MFEKNLSFLISEIFGRSSGFSYKRLSIMLIAFGSKMVYKYSHSKIFLCKILLKISLSQSPLKGEIPTNISKITTPSAHKSTLTSLLPRRSISGAKYSEVPLTTTPLP